MEKILRRFTVPGVEYNVVFEDGQYYFSAAGCLSEPLSTFGAAEIRFIAAMEDMRRLGLCPRVDDNLTDECKTPDEPAHTLPTASAAEWIPPDEPARTLPTASTAAPEEEKPGADLGVLENPHYAAQQVQPIDLIETLGSSELIGFLRGNIIKYTARAGKKSGEPVKKEARKALWYALRWFIEVGGNRADVVAVLDEMKW